MAYGFRICTFICFFTFCNQVTWSQESKWLSTLLFSDTNKILKEVLHQADRFRVQIIYTEIIMDKESSDVRLENHYFRYMPEEYFYPASMVKLPIAALTLEWLDENQLSKELYIKTKAQSWCTRKNRRYAPHGAKIKDLIAQSLIVSDNMAFNELYELLGPQYIYEKLLKKGYESAKIIQRLKGCDRKSNLTTDSVILTDEKGFYRVIPGRYFETSLRNENAVVGDVSRDYGKKQTGKDFADNNFISLHDLHSILIKIVINEKKKGGFDITSDNLDFLRSCLSSYPHEWRKENSSHKTTQPTTFKYLLMGSGKDSIPDNIRIFNKVGLAYGFMTDCAYIADYLHKKEFFVSATIFANKDEVIGDGFYNYYDLGFPFMKRLGELLYDYEINKDSKNKEPLPYKSLWLDNVE